VAEFPSLPLFTDSLIADTGHLTNEEFGAYMRLMVLTWRNPGCRIPNDDMWVMRRVGCNQSDYNRLYKPLLDEFFKTTGNWLFQKRLKKEFSHIKKYRKRQSDNAKLRWNKEKEPSHRNAQSGNAPNPTQPIVKKEEAKASLKEKITLEKLSTEHIEKWLAKKRQEGKYVFHDEKSIFSHKRRCIGYFILARMFYF